MGFLKKMTDFLAPPEEDYDEDEMVEEERAERPAAKDEVRKIAGGTPFVVRPAAPPRRPELSRVPQQPGRLAVGEMKVGVFVPSLFDDVAAIADLLKANRAAIINFERCEGKEQQRIFDFLNGVCYVLNGGVTLISPSMVLYSPECVKIEDWRK